MTIKFESPGLPVRAFDTISFNGIAARVLKVNSTIDPIKNTWWQTLEVERFNYTNTFDIKSQQSLPE